MSVKRVEVYFHRAKEDNFELAEELGIDLDSPAGKKLLHVGYEICVEYDVNLDTGEAVAVGIKK